MADEATGSTDSRSNINAPYQLHYASDDLDLRAKFNLTSFYTSTKACPVDYYQVSDGFIDQATSLGYYRFPAGLVPYSFTDNDESIYSSQTGPIDIDEYPTPTVSGTVSSSSFHIEVLDGKKPNLYNFKIKVWVLGG